MELHFREGDNPAQFKKTAEPYMQEHIDHLVDELKKMRSNRAHTSLVEDVMVNCYESYMRLKDVAHITAPDAQTIVVQPWDKTVIPAVEKALLQADVGTTPQADGTTVRLNLPPMSSERREELAKSVNKKLEEAKVSIRNERKKLNNAVRGLEKNKAISEDTHKKLEEALQDVTDTFVKKAEEIAHKRQEEIRST